MTAVGERDAVRSALSSCPPVASAAPEVLEAVVTAARLRTLRPGEVVYETADPPHAMFVVESGRIAARLTSHEGDTVDMTVVGPGALFGHLDLLDGGRRSCAAVAVTPARVVEIGAAAATRLFTSSPQTVLAVAAELASIVRQQTDAVRARTFHPVTARLAQILLVEADEHGRVTLDGPQSLLAQRVGVARQTLNKALRRLEQQRLVAVEPGGRAVTVLDHVGLGVAGRALLRQRTGAARPAVTQVTAGSVGAI